MRCGPGLWAEPRDDFEELPVLDPAGLHADEAGGQAESPSGKSLGSAWRLFSPLASLPILADAAGIDCVRRLARRRKSLANPQPGTSRTGSKSRVRSPVRCFSEPSLTSLSALVFACPLVAYSAGLRGSAFEPGCRALLMKDRTGWTVAGSVETGHAASLLSINSRASAAILGCGPKCRDERSVRPSSTPSYALLNIMPLGLQPSECDPFPPQGIEFGRLPG